MLLWRFSETGPLEKALFVDLSVGLDTQLLSKVALATVVSFPENAIFIV